MRTKGTKNKGRKGLSLLLVMCMVLSLLPVTAMAAEQNCTGDHTGWAKLSGNVSSLPGGKKYVLTGDVEVQDDIFINSEVTLCLSGHTMDLNGHNITINGNTETAASLALHDCAGSGSITGGNGGTTRPDRYGGAVYVGARATFSMYGGAITQNTASNGGGVYVGGAINKEITSSMSGSAKITGNTATSNGGGMYVSSGTGSFSMSGSAQITGNTADYGGGVHVNYTGFSMSESAKIAQNQAHSNGGGVYLAGSSSKGSFSMSGSAQIAENKASNGGGGYVQNGSFSMSESAQIAQNTANAGGGAYVTSNGSFSMSESAKIAQNDATRNGGGLFMDGTAFTVSGNVKVTGNGKSTADGTGNNVRLAGSGKTVTIGTGGLQDGAEIGVNMSQAGVFTSGGGEAYEGYFYSDSFRHVIVKESDELKLEDVSAHPHSHTLSGEGDEEAFLPLSTSHSS